MELTELFSKINTIKKKKNVFGMSHSIDACWVIIINVNCRMYTRCICTYFNILSSELLYYIWSAFI